MREDWCATRECTCSLWQDCPHDNDRTDETVIERETYVLLRQLYAETAALYVKAITDPDMARYEYLNQLRNTIAKVLAPYHETYITSYKDRYKRRA